MTDMFSTLDSEMPVLREIFPGRRLKGTVAGIFTAADGHFETSAVDELHVGFDGITGDYHAGLTRRAGGREPWYPRGTEIRNERQISILGGDELQSIASAMGLASIAPEWLGANLVLEALPALSMLAPRTLLFFEGGVTLKVDGQNAPCKIAGSAIARNLDAADPTSLALAFVQAAKRLRGLVAWVEKPGIIRKGESVVAKIPEQWIYRG